MFKGIGASAGIGIGSTVLVREPDLDYSHVVFAGEAVEKARLAAAAARFTEKTRAMKNISRWLSVAAAMEVEAGSEPSAGELLDIIELVRSEGIPAVFTEENGTTDAASLVASETGAAVFALDLAMGQTDHLSAIKHNIDTVKEALR